MGLPSQCLQSKPQKIMHASHEDKVVQQGEIVLFTYGFKINVLQRLTSVVCEFHSSNSQDKNSAAFGFLRLWKLLGFLGLSFSGKPLLLSKKRSSDVYYWLSTWHTRGKNNLPWGISSIRLALGIHGCGTFSLFLIDNTRHIHAQQCHSRSRGPGLYKGTEQTLLGNIIEAAFICGFQFCPYNYIPALSVSFSFLQ